MQVENAVGVPQSALQFPGIKRFGDKIVGAGVETFNDVLLEDPCG